MKNFFFGFFGFFLALVIYSIARSQYSDYRSRAQVYNWVVFATEIQKDVENEITKNDFNINATDFSLIKHPSVMGADFFVNSYGQIIVRGKKYGQLVLLFPGVNKNQRKIEWKCIGGPAADMPKQCK
jgi:hypothetical protein